MMGLRLRVPPADFAAAGREERVLVIPAAENVVRLLPPLIIAGHELDEGVARLEATCRRLEAGLIRQGAAE